MLTFRYGIAVDMGPGNGEDNRAAGRVTAITAHSNSRVRASTSTGAEVVLSGHFDGSSQASLRASPMTGVQVFDAHGTLVISVTGISDVTLGGFLAKRRFSDFTDQLLLSTAQGISITSGRFHDSLKGFDGPDRLSGGGGNDALFGMDGDDILNGSAGNDALVGGRGNDRMIGGIGDDFFVVDSLKDVVIELANAGVDVVRANFSYSLAPDIENLSLSGRLAIDATGNASSNGLTGNSAANVLKGLAGNDILNGGPGADRMEGGVGNDAYFVDSRIDVVLEKAGAGVDTVKSSVSYTLGSNLENLSLLGSANLDGAGNGLNNELRGNRGINHLSGGNGADTLYSEGGHDALSGGAGADVFVFSGYGSDSDLISDFLSGTDHLRLDASVFPGLSTAESVAEQFRYSNAAPGGNDYLVYNIATGVLAFNQAGGDSAIFDQIVKHGAGTVLLASDIQVI